MNITIKEKPELKVDPFKYDVTGAHAGQSLEIEHNGLVITINEMITGLGNSYSISAKHRNEETRKIFFFVDDEGELHLWKDDNKSVYEKNNTSG